MIGIILTIGNHCIAMGLLNDIFGKKHISFTPNHPDFCGNFLWIAK
jgi:hypothetical protein